jgi:hypothetical protein
LETDRVAVRYLAVTPTHQAAVMEAATVTAIIKPTALVTIKTMETAINGTTISLV